MPEIKLFGIFAALTVILTLAWEMYLDYLAFVALGPGGTSPTMKGFVKVKLLSFFSVANPYQPRVISGRDLATKPYLEELPVRTGERPVSRGIAPHRQVTDKASQIILERLLHAIAVLSSSGESVVLGTSCIEKHGSALFNRLQTRDNEICHVHCIDGSMHAVLSKADSRVVLEAAWGERHPLSHGGWFERFVPADFVMIYAPRDEAEVETILRILRAAA